MPAPISSGAAPSPPSAAGASGSPPPSPGAGTPAKPGGAGVSVADGIGPAGTPSDRNPFDVTAESAPDSAASLSQAAIRRAELFLLATHMRDQEQQARLDRMRSDFDNAQAKHAELLRESNVLRDMMLEQMKHEDEIVKKFISWI